MHKMVKQYIFNLTLPVIVQVTLSEQSLVIVWEVNLDNSHLENSKNIVLKLLFTHTRIIFLKYPSIANQAYSA